MLLLSLNVIQSFLIANSWPKLNKPIKFHTALLNLECFHNYEQHIGCKAFQLLNFGKSLNQEREAGSNFVLLFQSRNMVGQFKKSYLHTPIKILHFLTPAKIQTILTQLQNILWNAASSWCTSISLGFS